MSLNPRERKCYKMINRRTRSNNKNNFNTGTEKASEARVK
jgi:hypothetical protein